MAFRFLFILACFGVLSPLFVLAAPSPVLSFSGLAKRTLWKRQGGPQFTPPHDADFALPPPDDVFKYMADPNSYTPPVDAETIAPDTSGADGSAAAEPFKPITGTTLESPNSNAHSPLSTKLVIVAAVMAGVIGFIICAYFVLDWHVFGCCRKRTQKKQDPEKTMNTSKDSENSLPPSPDSSLLITVNGLPQGAAAPRLPASPRVGNLAPYRDGFSVIDIGPNGPIKPQSFISVSDYSTNALSTMRPFSSAVTSEGTDSARSSSFAPTFASGTPRSSAAATERDSSGTVLTQPGNAPLLPPHEFFLMSSTPKDGLPLLPHQQQQQIKAAHVPNKPGVFGHQPTKEYSASEGNVSPVKSDNSMKRAGDHRKSKSISGLVYVVDGRSGDGAVSRNLNQKRV